MYTEFLEIQHNYDSSSQRERSAPPTFTMSPPTIGIFHKPLGTVNFEGHGVQQGCRDIFTPPMSSDYLGSFKPNSSAAQHWRPAPIEHR